MKEKTNSLKDFFSRLGPGLITGASDDDPSGIGTYTQAGAALGFATLWTAIVTLPLMIVVQHICAKIGMVSGQGLAGVLKKFYSRWLLYPAVFGLIVANTINAGTDMAAIAAAINMFVPVPIPILVIPIAVLIVVLQVWGSYRFIVKVFKWLTLSLFAYIIAAFLARPNWSEVLYGTVVPQFQFSGEYITTVVALLGTTISPYLFFWQASEEVEEEVAEGRESLSSRLGATDDELKHEKWDTITGMALSNIVAYFVILAAASTLFAAGKNDIRSAVDAAQALRPLAGNAASFLFAAGIIGTGLLGVPVLTSSSAYAVSETFGWTCSLDEKPRHAKRFYSVIGVSTLIGLLVNYSGINPITALFWTAVINGVIAPPLLIVVLFVSNNKRVVGDRTNGVWTNVVGWLAAVIMVAAAIGMLLTWNS
ncbi:MAG TPA: Nramp family divalent metal transporter [Pyrinomonadaceae bacterium]|nr:Nramp family divalent metal transporter [Pyrinomonadaceae bacterium]